MESLDVCSARVEIASKVWAVSIAEFDAEVSEHLLDDLALCLMFGI
jgi:hypothetical protein